MHRNPRRMRIAALSSLLIIPACGAPEVTQDRVDAVLAAAPCQAHPIRATVDADRHQVRWEAPMLARLADHPDEAGVSFLITQVALLGGELSRSRLYLDPSSGEARLQLVIDTAEGSSEDRLRRAHAEICGDAERLAPRLRRER